jgi:hypothetical protein
MPLIWTGPSVETRAHYRALGADMPSVYFEAHGRLARYVVRGHPRLNGKAQLIVQDPRIDSDWSLHESIEAAQAEAERQEALDASG